MQFINSLYSIFTKYSIAKSTRYYSLVYAVFTILVLVGFYFLRDFLTPLILAIFFAYGLNAIVSRLENRGFPSFIAIVIPLMGFITLISLVFLLFYINIESFLEDKLPFYENKFFNLLEKAKQNFQDKEELVASLSSVLKDIVNEGKVYLVSLLKTTTSLLSDLFLFVLYLCFFLAGIKNFKIKTNRALGFNRAKIVNKINERIVNQIQNYVLYKTLINLSLAFSVYIVFLLYGLDLALVFAFLTFILNYVPIIGSSIASFLPILLALLQFSSILYVSSFAIIIIGLQLIFANVIEPRVFSKSLALSSFVVFVSLIFWSWLWGIAGAFLSIPIMASIGIICDNIPSLRPISRLLQNAFPLSEDREKLSLIHHIIHADSQVSSHEQQIIEEELKKDIYNPLGGNKLWREIQKKPLSLEEIFNGKLIEDKVKLYYIACKIAYIDNISNKEKAMLKKIETLNCFHKITIDNIQKLVILDTAKKEKKAPTKDKLQKEKDILGENRDNKEREIAFSYKLLGKIYFEMHNQEKAKESYAQSLKLYLLLEDETRIFECSRYLSVLSAL